MRLGIFILFIVLASSQSPFAQSLIDWEVSLGGSQSDQANDIIQTSDGGFLVAGFSYSNDGDATLNQGGKDGWVVKLGPSGAIEWQQSYGGSKLDEISAIIQLDNGGYLFTGLSASSDGDLDTNYGLLDYWVGKLDPSGATIWQKSFGGTNNDLGNTLIATADGNYLVTGYSFSTDFDVSTNIGESDVWLIKLDPLGNIIWDYSYGGTEEDYAVQIIPTSDNGYAMICGSHSDDGEISAPIDGFDYWIVKLSNNGTMEWEKSLGGNLFDYASSIAQTEDEGFVVLGHSYSSDVFVSTNYGSSDLWLAKLDPLGNFEWESSFGGSNKELGGAIVALSNGGCIISGSTFSNDFDVSNNAGSYDFWLAEISLWGNLLWEQNLGGSNSDNAFCMTQIDNGNLVIAGSTLSSDGDISNNNGSKDFWVVALSVTTGENDIKSPIQTLKTYPNPILSSATISWTTQSSGTLVNLSIYNTIGETMYFADVSRRTFVNIDFSGYPPGLYFTRLSSIEGDVIAPFEVMR